MVVAGPTTARPNSLESRRVAAERKELSQTSGLRRGSQTHFHAKPGEEERKAFIPKLQEKRIEAGMRRSDEMTAFNPRPSVVNLTP
jgi:hypothetical protein